MRLFIQLSMAAEIKRTLQIRSYVLVFMSFDWLQCGWRIRLRSVSDNEATAVKPPVAAKRLAHLLY